MEPIAEEGGILQEWAPETGLLQQIPLKVQKGLFSKYVNLTCLDVVPEYIALGTNCGLIYWYNRAKNEIQRLRLESSNCTITCVKIVSTVDYMVAAGTDTGNITVFQIPKILPESLPPNLKPKKNQVERFTINGLHTVAITSIEWSQNGMKLFSGDKGGTVVLTEIDFYMHITKSVELLNEQFEIVQLKYNQQILLISTTFRSIICDGHDKWKVHQVGTKERKILGRFGATFCNFDNEWVIYVTRPGHRLWLSSLDGTVRKTLLFKSTIFTPHPKIQLINPVSKIQSGDTSFGKLLQFGCNKIVVYNHERMYVLHPQTISTITSLDSARRIIDLAVNDDEIFILEGERSLLRIGYAPNKFCTDAVVEETSKRRSFNLDDIATKLKDTALESLKKITSELVITPEPTSPVSQPVLADEALDLPPIVNLPAGSISTIIPDENVEVHFSVDVEEIVSATGQYDNDKRLKHSQESSKDTISRGIECSEVLSRPLRRRSSRKNKVLPSVRVGQEPESDVISNVSDDRLTLSQLNEMSASDESSISFSQSQSSFSILRDISTLLTANNEASAISESFYDEASKNFDDNSQISLDTCESVSENLKLTPDRFLEEQEKTFYRLANQDIGILDSSEKTDNMSVSLNATPSSSISSKISNSGQWVSEVSENMSMVSEGKTEGFQNDLPLPKQLCFYRPNSDAKGNAFDEDDEVKPSGSGQISLLCETRCEISDIDNISSTAVLSVDLDNEEKEELTDEKPTETEKDYSSFFPPKNSPEMDLAEGMSSELKPDFDLEEHLTFTENEDLDKCDGDEFLARNLEEQSDHWLQYAAPGPVISLAVASTYVVCVNSKEQVYFSRLSGLSLSWNPLTYKASRISVSNNANTVWVLNKKTLFSLVNPSKIGPHAEDMLERYTNVKFFTLDNENPEGWIVTIDGQVKHQRNVEFLYEKPEHVPCDWLLTKITCWNGIVLAITSEGSLVCKPPNEENFRSISTPKPVIVNIALGPDRIAWVVDKANSIYFSDDFLGEEPHWWQIIISDYMFQNSPSLLQNIQTKLESYSINERMKRTMVASNENSVWVYDKFSATLKVNKSAVTGRNLKSHVSKISHGKLRKRPLRVNFYINLSSINHIQVHGSDRYFDKCIASGRYIWEEVVLTVTLPFVKWQLISANSVFETGGLLWLQSICGDLFNFSMSSKNSPVLKSVPVPSQDIRCISSSAGVLWLLSTDGHIYARLGLSCKYSVGSSWKELIAENLRLTWVSCGRSRAWGCDHRGKVCTTTESPHQITAKSSSSEWAPVEGHPEDGIHFEKVFVGPNFCMVWAIDNKQNIYFRDGISPHVQTGTNWILVTGIQASIITISKTSVWVLSPKGSVYRRYGVTETNYMGDYWKGIPGNLSSVTSTFGDELWGIDQNNKILRLRRKTKVLATKKESSRAETVDSASLNESENEWEIPKGFNWP